MSFGNGPTYIASVGYMQPPAPTYGDTLPYEYEDENSSSSSSEGYTPTYEASSVGSKKKEETDSNTIASVIKEKLQTSDESKINMYRKLFSIYNKTLIKDMKNVENNDLYFDAMNTLVPKTTNELRIEKLAIRDMLEINKFAKNDDEKKEIIEFIKILKTNPKKAERLKNVISQIIKEYDNKKIYEKKRQELQEKQKAEIETLMAKHEEELAKLK